MLAVFSVIPYELSTRTPEICSNRFRIGIGIAVEPQIAKAFFGANEDAPEPIVGDRGATILGPRNVPVELENPSA